MDALTAALTAALAVSPAPIAAPVHMTPVTIAQATQRQGATASDEAILAGLSVVDLVQTQNWLHMKSPTGAWEHPPIEINPLLGKRPSLLRMAVTGAAVDSAVLRIRSPFLRRFSIGFEAANVARNFSVGMHL